jgi:hypothetical protein
MGLAEEAGCFVNVDEHPVDYHSGYLNMDHKSEKQDQDHKAYSLDHHKTHDALDSTVDRPNLDVDVERNNNEKSLPWTFTRCVAIASLCIAYGSQILLYYTGRRPILHRPRPQHCFAFLAPQRQPPSR